MYDIYITDYILFKYVTADRVAKEPDCVGGRTDGPTKRQQTAVLWDGYT